MGDEALIINFEGNQTIDKSGTNRDLLLKALKGKKKQILLDLSNVEKVDLSFLQLIHAAELEASSSRKSFSLTGTIPTSLRDAVALSGYDRFPEGEIKGIFAQIKGKGEDL